MLLPTLKRIFTADFPKENQSLIEKLSFLVNTNTEVLFQALNKNITLKDNVSAQIVDLTVKVDVNGTPSTSLTFNNTLSSSILGIQVLRAASQTNTPVYPTGGIFCSFSQSGNTVTINNIAGLPANTSFALTIVTYS